MAKFKKYIGTDNQYRFRLVANNGEKILSSEGYTTSYGRDNGIESVKTNAPYDSRYQRKIASNGQHYFTLHAANGETIGVSETYITSSNRDYGIEVVKREAAYAPVESVTV